MVQQTKQKPRRGRGRPKSEDKLVIDSERAQFKLKSRIIDVSPEALEVIYELMRDKSAPGQTRSSNAKIILEMAAELHKQLIESEAAELEESVEVTEDKIEENEQEKGIVVNFGA
ncbi:hypothetical protein BNNNBJKE_00009 [Aeromonas phage vB_AdhM_DL]|nr:hypothetical protein BNCALIDO_00063 [Aeromonas phage vB_AdhM_TS9]WBF79594.1 hypothetical protein BNNNBJKE_00009 [Aeromonas phage vB_AdhM_DL]